LKSQRENSHADADIRAYGITLCRNVGQSQVDLVEGVEELQLFGAVHLHRSETALHCFFCGTGGVGRTVATDPRVDADLVAHLAAEQVADRHAQMLALDIPQGLVDPGQGAHVHRATAIEAAAVEHSPDVFDIARVLADQVIGQFFHGGRHGMGAALDDWLTPAGDALVGLDLEEAPARRHDISGEFGDFHNECSLVR
jgi:hypothetical protein